MADKADTIMAKSASIKHVKAVTDAWQRPYTGLYSKGLTLTILEDSNVPIVRSFERAPCDAALLLDDDVAQLEPDADLLDQRPASA